MNLIEVAEKACNDWWNTYTDRTTTKGKLRKTRGEFAQENLRTALTMFKAVVDANLDSQFLYDFPRKCGYGILGGNDGIKTGLRSVNLSRGEKSVKDHVFGATLAGEEVLKAFKEWDYDIDYMVNEWLPKNLYYFAIIELTKEEHNILDTHKHTKNQKRNLEHYANLGIELEYNGYAFKNTPSRVIPKQEVVTQFFNFEK